MERIRLWAQWRTARRAKSSPGGRLDCDAIRPSRLQTRTPSPESRRACHESGRQGPDPRFYQFLAWFGRVYFSVLLLDMSLQPVPSGGTNSKREGKIREPMVPSPIVRLAAPFAAKTLCFRDVLPSPFRADIAELADLGTAAALIPPSGMFPMASPSGRGHDNILKPGASRYQISSGENRTFRRAACPPEPNLRHTPLLAESRSYRVIQRNDYGNV